MLDIEIPLIVGSSNSNISSDSNLGNDNQGILPSLILIVVHFKNVLGTREERTATQPSAWMANRPFEVNLNTYPLATVQTSSQIKA
jgi:hypothetical protein